jgi:hypothetical protein
VKAGNLTLVTPDPFSLLVLPLYSSCCFSSYLFSLHQLPADVAESFARMLEASLEIRRPAGGRLLNACVERYERLTERDGGRRRGHPVVG